MIPNFKNLLSGCIAQQTERADVKNDNTDEFLAEIENLLRKVAENPEQVGISRFKTVLVSTIHIVRFSFIYSPTLFNHLKLYIYRASADRSIVNARRPPHTGRDSAMRREVDKFAV